jgi:hypothetical protein
MEFTRLIGYQPAMLEGSRSNYSGYEAVRLAQVMLPGKFEVSDLLCGTKLMGGSMPARRVLS